MGVESAAYVRRVSDEYHLFYARFWQSNFSARVTLGSDVHPGFRPDASLVTPDVRTPAHHCCCLIITRLSTHKMPQLPLDEPRLLITMDFGIIVMIMPWR
jgi:hypothetical protein